MNHSHRRNNRGSFKGKFEKMRGNVFQLAEESRNTNQFTKTLEALWFCVIFDFGKHFGDLAPYFRDPCQEPTIELPADEPPMPRDTRSYIMWECEVRSYVKRLSALPSNKLKLYTVIWLQCSHSVKMKLQATAGYKEAKESHDCKWILTNLRNIC
jgi:hypothetical protein